MGLQFRRRTNLTGSSSSTVQAWVNWSTSVPSISVRIGPVTFNTKRGLSTVRTGVPGLTYHDEDKR